MEPMPQRVLLIGGSRFFGKRIVRKFLERGDQVTLFTRGGSRPDFWSRVTSLIGDRSDHARFEAALAGSTFDVVIDNIAYNRADVESAIRAFTGRIGHYLLCSSGSVYRDYDDSRQLTPRREGDADLDFKGDLDYSEGKRQAEAALVERPEPERPFPFTIIRPPVVQGPDDPSARGWYWIQRVADGREILVPRCVPSTLFTVAWSDDIAEAFVAASGNRAAFGNAYNVAGAEIFSIEDYVRATGRALGVPVRIASAPLERIRQEPGLADFEPPLATDRFIMDSAAARRDLHFRPTPADIWMEITAKWFLNDFTGGSSPGYDARELEVAAARRLGFV